MKIPKHGFTLLEVMMAIAIFAMVSVMGYNVLNVVVETDSFTKERSSRLAEIQRAFWIIANDLRQIADRGIAVTEEQRLPALLTGKNSSVTDDSEFFEEDYFDPDLDEEQDPNDIPYLIEFTRRGWSNPLNTPRSEMQRVAYELSFDFYEDKEFHEDIISEDDRDDNNRHRKRYTDHERNEGEGYLDDDEFTNKGQGGVLIRHYWVTLDHIEVEVFSDENDNEELIETEPEVEELMNNPEQDEAPTINDLRPVSKQQILLTSVQSVKFRFMDEESEWHDSWPLEEDMDEEELFEDEEESAGKVNESNKNNTNNSKNRENSAEKNNRGHRSNRGPQGPMGESARDKNSRSASRPNNNNPQNPFSNIVKAVENARNNREEVKQDISTKHSLPMAIEITMNVQPYGEITRLFRVNRFPLQEPSEEEENQNNNNRERNKNSRERNKDKGLSKGTE